jgi:hypothetical protein
MKSIEVSATKASQAKAGTKQGPNHPGQWVSQPLSFDRIGPQ